MNMDLGVVLMCTGAGGRQYCGANAANWNTKKNVMDALKASPMWTK